MGHTIHACTDSLADHIGRLRELADSCRDYDMSPPTQVSGEGSCVAAARKPASQYQVIQNSLCSLIKNTADFLTQASEHFQDTDAALAATIKENMD